MNAFTPHDTILLNAAGEDLVGKLTVGEHGDNTGDEFPGEHKATLNGVEGKATGSVDIFYDRLDIGELLEGKKLRPLAIRTNNLDNTQLLEILQGRGINITEQDLNEPDLSVGEDGGVDVVISSGSLLLNGSFPVVVLPLEEGQEGYEVINQEGVALFPTDVLGEEEVGPGTLSGVETKTTGALLIGTGNKGTHLQRATNGELSLALGIRQYRVDPEADPVDGTYALALPKDGDWSVVFSAGLHGGLFDGETQLGLLDVYDIKMTWEKTDSDERLIWTAVPGEGRIDWLSHDENLRIVDGPESLQVAQNMQRLTHYIENNGEKYFTPSDVLSENATTMIGDFVFTIDAVRKNTAGDVRLSVSVIAEISEEQEEVAS